MWKINPQLLESATPHYNHPKLLTCVILKFLIGAFKNHDRKWEMINDTAIDYINRALTLARVRHAEILAIKNNKGLEPMYNSIVQQLIYLKNVVTGQEKDKIKLKELTMGLYAAKEFEASDPVFANQIFSASFIAHKIRNGLKIKLPHEMESDYYERQKKPRNEHPNDFQG